MRFLQHVATKLHHDGLASTIRAGAHWIGDRLWPQERSAFDAASGCDTDGLVSPWQITLATPRSVTGVRYQPTPAAAARRMLAALPIDRAAFHLVDLGCGKGRVLLIAAELGFRSVVGVEYGLELADVALRNVERAGLAGRVRVLCEDAASYPVPDDCVVFMYNPFGAAVMGAVAASIARARNVYVVYFEPDPRCVPLLDAVAERIPAERGHLAWHRA